MCAFETPYARKSSVVRNPHSDMVTMLVVRFLFFIFLLCRLSKPVVAQLDDLLLPDLTIDLPVRQLQFSAQTGTTLQCELQRDSQPNEKATSPLSSAVVQWLVYSFLEQRFVQLDDSELVKQVNTNTESYLSFLPFTSDQYNANVHNNFFRCVLASDKYRVAGQVARIKACEYFFVLKKELFTLNPNCNDF